MAGILDVGVDCACERPAISSRFGLVDRTTEAMVELDTDGVVVRAYPHVTPLFVRVACGETRLESLVPKSCVPVLLDRIRRAREADEAATVEFAVASPDGSRTSVVRVRIAPAESGVFLLFRGQDVDSRVSLERDTDAERSFWEFFEVAPLAIVVGYHQTASTIGPARMNRMFTELFGYEPEEVPTIHDWWPLAYPDEVYRDRVRTEWFARLASARAASKRIESIETRVRCKDGTDRDIEFGASTIGPYDVVTFIDHTERLRATRELAERIEELEVALGQVKVLRGLLPLCAWCRKVRDDRGYWSRVEDFLARNTDLTVTHGICPECQSTHFKRPTR